MWLVPRNGEQRDGSMLVAGTSRRLRLPADRRLRRVLLAYGISTLVEFATWLTILLVAYDRGGPVGVGVASFAMLLPAIMLVPLLAGFGDRLPRGRALSLAYLSVAVSSAATGVLVVAGAPSWSVLVGGAALTIAVSLVRPMHFAALPFLASRPGDLVAANGLSSMVEGVSLFVGFALAGVITDLVGPWVVLLAAGLLGGVSAALTSGLDLPRAVVPGGHSVPEMRAALQGFAALRGRWGAVALLLLLAATAVVEGANDTLTVTFNDQVLGGDASTAGLIAGAYGVGVALGGATLAGLAHRPRVAPMVLAGALLLGGAEAAVALLGALGPVVVMLVLVGAGVSMIVVSARTLLQRTTDSQVLARVLAVQEGVYLVGLAVGALLGPAAVVLLGPRAAFLAFGLAIATVGLLSFRTIRPLDGHATLARREVDLLSQVGFLAMLPPYELERLAQAARWESVPAGVDVVRQGERGDAYYLIAEGRASVAVDGVLRAHTLGAGEGFGEIALLHDVDRTATVTTIVDTTLLVVDSGDFLAAVTSSADGSGMAREISRAKLESDRRAG